MGKRLPSVPIYFSPPQKLWCGPASAKMVLEYHGIKLSITKIAQRCHASAGVWMPSLALLFIDLGFNVNLYSWDSTMPGRFMDLPDDEIRKHIYKWSRRRKLKRRADREYRRSVTKFLNYNGIFIPRVYEGFNIRKMSSALKRKESIILNVSASPLWGEWDNNARRSDHIVVLTRINSKAAVINDPSYGKIELPTSLLRFACFFAAQANIMYIWK